MRKGRRKPGDLSSPHDVTVFEREAKIVENAREVERNNSLSPGELRSYYKELIKEYGKLLRKTEKITHIGDSNQRKLLAAYDKIETQNLQLYKARQLTGPTRPKANSWPG